MNPHIILLFSGKRKSGKDYITDQLRTTLGDRCEVIKISQPIKGHFAKENNLNLEELLSDGPYKESYRLEMINWSDERRDADYGCFCRAACQNAATKSIWIVSDIRRKTDIRWFKENYGNVVKLIRITADDETRRQRGFVFKKDVDDVKSECDLDDFTEWDLVVENGVDRQPLEQQLASILSLLSHL